MRIQTETSMEKAFLSAYNAVAILAGGALRDTTLGQPVQDYDFYLEYSQETVDYVYGMGFVNARKGKANKVYDDPNIVCVFTSANTNFDVIFVKGDPIDHIRDYFCTDFSKVWGEFDEDGYVTNISYHDGFKDSVDSHIIKVNMAVHNNPHTFHTYLPKLHKKYPDYTIELDWEEYDEASLECVFENDPFE